jgi:hypothetical protein
LQKGSSFSTPERFYRRGRGHRCGWLTSFSDVRERFGFRSLQIGTWVTKAEKETAGPLFYDALCDFMCILQGPETLILLRNT